MSKKEINRVGEVHITNSFGSCKVIEYLSCEKVLIKFIETTYEVWVTYSNLIKGKVQDPLFKSVKGIGFRGIGIYSKTVNTKLYNIWYSMMDRCYYEDYSTKYTSYENCFVCETWHNFQNFAKWAESRYKEGFDLDKDVLGKNNFYSEATCCFIPMKINRMLRVESGGYLNNRGMYSFRVKNSNGEVESKYCKLQTEGKSWYKERKEFVVREVAEQYKDVLECRVYKALREWVVVSP